MFLLLKKYCHSNSVQTGLRKKSWLTSEDEPKCGGRGERLARHARMSQSSASPLRENYVTYLMARNFRSRLSEPVSVDPTLQTHLSVCTSLCPTRPPDGREALATIDITDAADAVDVTDATD